MTKEQILKAVQVLEEGYYDGSSDKEELLNQILGMAALVKIVEKDKEVVDYAYEFYKNTVNSRIIV